MNTRILYYLFFFCSIVYGQNASEKVILKSQKSLDSLINVGLDNIKNNNLSLSIIHLNKALKLANSLHDLDKMAKIYNAIGVNYHLVKDIDNASLFYNKSFEVAQEGELPYRQAIASANISQIHFLSKDFKQAEKFALLSIELSKEASYEYNELITNINLINIYVELQNWKKGENIIKFLNQEFETLKEHKLVEGYYLTLAKYYDKTNNDKLAEIFYKKSIQLNEERGFVTTENIRLDYANFLYKNKDYQLAFLELKKQLSENEKASIKEKKMISESLGVLKNAYQSHEELEKIRETNIAITYTLTKYRILLAIIITLFIITVATGFFLYKSNKKRSNLLKAVNSNNKQLQEANQKMVELSGIKTNFIATITHEIRTPLYGIIGLTAILKEKNKKQENNEHLNSLDFSAKYLLSLINDILDLNKIEAEKKVELAQDTFNLKTEIDAILGTFESVMSNNNNCCIADIDATIPNLIISDKLKLMQIFVNLLSNALKFTKDGTITFKAEQIAHNDIETTIQFSITDTGKGISTENLSKIFDKFVQIDRQQNDYLGTGLGLSIVSNLIEQFNSKLIVESLINVGTTFRFTITFKLPKKPAIPTSQPDEIFNLQNLTILVVEDNKINQAVTKHILKKEKISCVIVDNGFSAIDKIKTEHFDLILMDLNMPEINGFETAKEIRKFNPTIPIIALTAFSKEEVIHEITKSGINDIITKPFEAEKLLKLIREITL